MNISQRLLFTLFFSLLAMLVVGFGGIWQLNQAEQRLEYFNENTLTSVRRLNAIKDSTTAIRVQLYRHALADDPKAKDDAEQEIVNAIKRFDDLTAKYEREDISNDADRKLLEEDRAALARYRAQHAAFFALSRSNDTAGLHAMLSSGELHLASAALRKQIDAHATTRWPRTSVPARSRCAYSVP